MLGSDSVSQFVQKAVGTEMSKEIDFVSFVSLAAPITLAGADCPAGKTTRGDLASLTFVDFCNRVAAYYAELEEAGYRTSPVPWLNEGTGLAYDAVKIFVDAEIEAKDLGHDDSRAIVFRKIREAVIYGVTAPSWTFGDSPVPSDKMLAILTINLEWVELPENASADPPCSFIFEGNDAMTCAKYIDPDRPRNPPNPGH